jgi:hypothetical protein
MKKTLILVLGVAIIVGAGAFYGGMTYGEGKKSSASFEFGNFNGQGSQRFSSSTFPGGRNNGGGLVSGQILSKDSSSITVQTQSGGSKIVFLSDSTAVSKFDSGNLSDLAVGKTVTITGTTNQDGSISASSIQLRPNLSTSTIP